MDNRGRIVVWMSLMTAAYLIVITFVLQVVILSVAQSKAVIASRLAMSDIKTGYNSYIFEHYHILLFDKNADGLGEAYLEERLQQDYEKNLGDEYQDTQVVFTDFTMIYDDSCEALYDQMQEHVMYALAEQGLEYSMDALLEKTGGTDGTLPDDLTESMQRAETEATEGAKAASETGAVKTENDTTASGIGAVKTDSGIAEAGADVAQEGEEQIETGDAQTGGEQVETGGWKEEKDPRDYTKAMTQLSLLRLVLPDDAEVSGAGISMEDLPSLQAEVVYSEYDEIDRNFDTMKNMTKDLTMLASWKDDLAGKAALPAYIQDVFNCYVDQKNETSVLQYEQEYLIAGKSSDFANLESVMNRIIGIRFPIDYISVCAQPQKMSRLRSIAVSLCWAVPGMIPVVKYLLAGCWAYIEAIADARVLFAGEKLAFSKTAENWITDIDNIEASILDASGGDEHGLSYQDYLVILEMMNSGATVYRMLDVMQVNAQQEMSSFQMKHAACGFEADFQTSFQDRTFRYHQSAAY